MQSPGPVSRSVEAGQGRPAATVRGASPERHGPAREAARGSARRAGSAGSGRLSPAFLSSPHFPAGSAPSLRSRRVSARPGWGQDGSLALAELGGNLETSGTRSALGSGKPAGRRALPHGTPLVSPGLSQESGRLPLSSISTPQGNVRFPLSVPFPKLGCPREAPGVGGGCCGLWSLFWKNLFSWGDLDVRTTCFVPKAKDVLSQAGPAERWSGILRSAAALSRPAAGRLGGAPTRAAGGGRGAGAVPGPGVLLARGPSARSSLPRRFDRPHVQLRLSLPAGRNSAEQNLPLQCSSCCWVSLSSTSPCWCCCSSLRSSA